MTPTNGLRLSTSGDHPTFRMTFSPPGEALGSAAKAPVSPQTRPPPGARRPGATRSLVEKRARSSHGTILRCADKLRRPPPGSPHGASGAVRRAYSGRPPGRKGPDEGRPRPSACEYTLPRAARRGADHHRCREPTHDTQAGPAQGKPRERAPSTSCAAPGSSSRWQNVPTTPRSTTPRSSACCVRAQEMARYVEDGALDCGLTGLRLGRRERGHRARGVRSRLRQAELRHGALGAGRAARPRTSSRSPTSRARSWPPSWSA